MIETLLMVVMEEGARDSGQLYEGGQGRSVGTMCALRRGSSDARETYESLARLCMLTE